MGCQVDRQEAVHVGYGGVKLALKSDGEAAIKALVHAVAISRKAETPIIQSPLRESRCNGAVERAVRTWRGQVVTLKDFVEVQVGKEMAADGAA